MPTRRTTDELTAQVAALELRVRTLERRLAGPVTASPTTAARRGPPRATCAGCSLELPAGRRGASCVWCGFRFDAVPPIPPRKRKARGL